MKRLRIVFILGLAMSLLAACSDKQEEAAKLEAEMMQLEGQEDSAAISAAEDSMAAAAADASAIPEEEQPEAQIMPPAPPGDGYTIQVASCEDPEYARYLVGIYGDRGYEAHVTTISYNNQTYYRVRVGSTESLAEARRLKAELIDKYSIEPWIDQLN